MTIHSSAAKGAEGKSIAATPNYLGQLKYTANSIALKDGRQCEVWELNVSPDDACVADWASRFRQTYCLDADIDVLREGTGYSRAEYLCRFVFPDEKVAPGPGIRAGDFAELLIADYTEFVLGYWVPREKYAEKGSRNESVKGVDIIGFKLKDPGSPDPSDSMLAFEVKAQLTDSKYTDRLQAAVDDSAKDYLRAADTLAAMKRRMHKAQKAEEVKVVQRFQNLVDHPYELHSGAAAMLSGKSFDVEALKNTETTNHNNVQRLALVVIKGEDLMTLAHSLYKRAADEA